MINLQIPSNPRQKFTSLFLSPMLDFPQRLGVIILALIVLSISQSLFLLLLGPFFKSLFTLGQLETIPITELFSSKITDYFPNLADVQLSKQNIIWLIPGGLLIAVFAKGVAGYFFQYNQQALSFHVAKRYRDRLFGAILNRSYHEINKRTPGEWMSVLMNDVLYLQSRYSDFMASFIKDSVLIISALAAMFIIHWQTAMVLLIGSPFLFVILGQISRRISHFAEGWQKDLGKMSGFILSLRKRYPFIQAQQSQSYEIKLFERLNDKYYHTIKKSIFLRSTFSPGLEMFGFLGFSGVLLLLSKRLFGQEFGPEELIQFLAALGVLLRPLKSLGEQVARLQETKGALQEGYKIFDHEFSSSFPEKSTQAPIKTNLIKIKYIAAGYNDKVRFIGSKFVLEPGKSIAIVGPSGAGKSTIVRTLVGLLPPIRWDADIDWKKFTQSTSFVSQKPFMFEDSIRNNLIYGLVQKVSEEDIWKSLEKVGIADHIQVLPEGLESKIAAVRSNFSGGQIQRLVIARSLLRGKPFLVLDEATSAIDMENEKLITHHLLKEVSGQRVGLLFVTHRLQWLHNFDEIWFVENGKVKLIGSHNQLLSSQRYSNFIKASSDY